MLHLSSAHIEGTSALLYATNSPSGIREQAQGWQAGMLAEFFCLSCSTLPSFFEATTKIGARPLAAQIFLLTVSAGFIILTSVVMWVVGVFTMSSAQGTSVGAFINDPVYGHLWTYFAMSFFRVSVALCQVKYINFLLSTENQESFTL